MSRRTPLIAGNWKKNMGHEETAGLIRAIAENIAGLDDVDVLVAPPFTSLTRAKKEIGDSRILLGAQNMHWEKSGAYTGEISAAMLLDVGCTHVILGHSERRILFKETSEMVDLKANAAVEAGLNPIVCIGETLEEREQGKTFEVVRDQLEKSLNNFRIKKTLPLSVTIAYEPVWAIGTGKTATPAQAQEVHEAIRQWIEDNFDKDVSIKLRILYGGSVKPENAKDLMEMPDIDGALVGGASLKAELFLPIITFGEPR
ncbi:MAG: triose-phosphate isomerase [Deltaproteobacteria bacterium]|nr:triose-phosphate isomerase [Deltaproteobacteria bacterium]